MFPDDEICFSLTGHVYFFNVLISTHGLFSVLALLEGFEIRECISFIEEHINRQVRLLKHRVSLM